MWKQTFQKKEMMLMISLDWAIKKKDEYYTEDNDGVAILYLDGIHVHDEVIFLEEGCPRAKLYNLLRNNNKVFMIDPKVVKEWKEGLEIEKTDKNDAKAIYLIAKESPESFRELTEKESVEINNEIFVKQYLFITKSLARIKNMSKAFHRQFGFDNSLFLKQIKELEEEKKKYYKNIEKLVKHDIKKVNNIKGVGARILGEILFIKHPKYFKDWRQYIKYCGFYADGRKTGKFNHALKDAYYLATRGVIMAKDEKYSATYKEIKTKLREEHPDKVKENGKIRWNNGHIDNIAKNRIATQLAKDVWQIFHGADNRIDRGGFPVKEPINEE